MRFMVTVEACFEAATAEEADDLAAELGEVLVAELGDRHIAHPTERWRSGHSLEGLDEESAEALQGLELD